MLSSVFDQLQQNGVRFLTCRGIRHPRSFRASTSGSFGSFGFRLRLHWEHRRWIQPVGQKRSVRRLTLHSPGSSDLRSAQSTSSAAQAPGHGTSTAPPGHGIRKRSAQLQQTRRSFSRSAGPPRRRRVVDGKLDCWTGGANGVWSNVCVVAWLTAILERLVFGRALHCLEKMTVPVQKEKREPFADSQRAISAAQQHAPLKYTLGVSSCVVWSLSTGNHGTYGL